MKIGILHLSDLHIQDDSLISRLDNLVNVLALNIVEQSHLYVVLSGDITNTGKENEFESAKLFIQELNEKLKARKRILQIEFIVVPGNHDCCFVNEKSTRKLIVENCIKDTVEEEDYFTEAMAVQSNFWKFAKEVTSLNDEFQVAYKYEFRPHVDFHLTFHCYNTSWLTQLDEKQGNLVIPQNKFIDNMDREYVISVFHHPIDWLSANTKKNNKQRFEEHIVNTSNLVLYGHEHDTGKAKTIVQKDNSVIFCGGKAFYNKDTAGTGFSLYEIDLSDKSVKTETYNYSDDDNVFSVEFTDTYTIEEKTKRTFVLTREFEKKITELKVPLKHSIKDKLTLEDIFIFPDLEPLDDLDVVQYVDSSEIIEEIKKENSSNILIEGADQSGKTSLLFVIYRKLYKAGYTPVYLRGKEFKNTELRQQIRRALKEQYNKPKLDLFLQEEKQIILLDNFHKSNLNLHYKKRLFEAIESFKSIIITSDNTYSSANLTEEVTWLKDYTKYKLLPLGHEKRIELIEKWFLLGENRYTIKEDEVLKSVKYRFDEINALLGNRLMPSYPIFVLTLLQGLEENLQNFSQTSYANIYLVLIKSALIKSGISPNELTAMLNILKELAFYIYTQDLSVFNTKQFDLFVESYTSSYFLNIPNVKILEALIHSNILIVDDGYYSFSYKYIYYYLIAQKISSEIDSHHDLIYDLCSNIHLEINANILIFISHHTKAQVLIDSIVFSSMVPFEEANVFTLNKDDDFVKFISEFTKEIKEEIKEEINPHEEIKKELKQKDAIERQARNNKSQEDKREELMTTEAIEMSQAFRTVKIIGQIVKNQSGDFEKNKLINLVEAAYCTVFRFLGFYSELLEKDKELIIDAVVEDIKEKTQSRYSVDDREIEKRVRMVLQFLSWRICVDSITNLMFSIGTKGQNELFETVNQNIDTTASRIVTFAIKTFYDTIDVRELEILFEEIKDNYLAQVILREYIKRYLYTNIVERTKRDRIIQIAGFDKQRIIRTRQLNMKS